jgi:hypothetical protein
MIVEGKRTLWKCDILDGPYIPGSPGDRIRVGDDGTHNLVSSLTEDGRHMPAIDLDIPHSYLPSSTPGHGHLFIDMPMSWEQYELLLTVLHSVGIIEDGFFRLSLQRKASFLRKPGTYKELEAAF